MQALAATYKRALLERYKASFEQECARREAEEGIQSKAVASDRKKFHRAIDVEVEAVLAHGMGP